MLALGKAFRMATRASAVAAGSRSNVTNEDGCTFAIRWAAHSLRLLTVILADTFACAYELDRIACWVKLTLNSSGGTQHQYPANLAADKMFSVHISASHFQHTRTGGMS
jgi:hypothetical protein